jgi:hypothetical protein
MPRPLKPWFHKRKNCWVIEPDGRLIRLADGPKNADTEKEARRQLDILKGQWAQNVPLESGMDKLTILALLDGYLVHMKARLADRTWVGQRRRRRPRYSQPPVNPARRSPVTTGGQRRMRSQSRPVR